MLDTTQIDGLDFKSKKVHPPMNIPESIILFGCKFSLLASRLWSNKKWEKINCYDFFFKPCSHPMIKYNLSDHIFLKLKLNKFHYAKIQFIHANTLPVEKTGPIWLYYYWFSGFTNCHT